MIRVLICDKIKLKLKGGNPPDFLTGIIVWQLNRSTKGKQKPWTQMKKITVKPIPQTKSVRAVAGSARLMHFPAIEGGD